MNPEPRSFIIDALLALEDEINDEGWFQPAMLLQLHLEDDELLGYQTPMTVKEPSQLTRVAEKFVDGSQIGDQLAGHLAAEPGFYGLALCAEAYTAEIGPAEAQQWLRSGRPFSEHPSSRRGRMLHAVDIYGRIYLLERQQGGHAQQSELQTFGGVAHDALLTMIRAVVARLPEGHGNPEAVLAMQSISFSELTNKDPSRDA